MAKDRTHDFYDAGGCAVIQTAVADDENRSLQKRYQWDETHTEGWDQSGEEGVIQKSEVEVRRDEEYGSDPMVRYL